MFKRISSACKMLGRKKAEEFSSLNTFEGQRPLREGWVKTLLAYEADSTYRRGEIATAKCNGDTFLVNGQHTVEVARRCKNSIPVVVDEYTCETREDLWKLFSTFDRHKTRNLRDTIRAFMSSGDCPRDLLEVPQAVMARAGKSIRIANGYPDISFRRVPDYEVVDAIKEHENEVLAVAIYGNEPLTRRRGLITAMVLTMRANEQKAHQFWEAVVFGLKFESKKDPAYKLRNSLITGLTSATRGIDGPWADRQYYYTSVVWWNAFLLGSARGSARYKPEMKLPKIAGLK